MNSFVVIPARLHSTRLPRKLLLNETGKSVLEHTYDVAAGAASPSGRCVATDHEEIASEVRRFGGVVRMTSPEAASGTDRVAEVAAAMPEVDIFVNLQGDEPELPSAAVDRVIELLDSDSQAVMATLAAPIRRLEQLQDPACVKVVCDRHGRALYFSRSPIPHVREWDDCLLAENPPRLCQHLGIYAYRREFLLHLTELPPSGLEKLERLEQLRVLEAGHTILVATIDEASRGIDTIEDYRAFVRRTRHR